MLGSPLFHLGAPLCRRIRLSKVLLEHTREGAAGQGIDPTFARFHTNFNVDNR